MQSEQYAMATKSSSSLLSPLERRLARRVLPRIPRWLETYHLTMLTLVWCAGLVFFGRLESRKGLELFCDALDVLAGRGALKGATVTFLGKNGRVRHEDGVRFVGRRTAHLGVPVRLESTMGQAEALDYLRQLAAYYAALARIYPDREIHCALLWTEGPRLMPISPEILAGYLP